MTEPPKAVADLGEAELLEERDFLLSSLTDLDAELAAGDIDQHDYITLKDGYTARAAAVLRALDALRGISVEPPPPASTVAPSNGDGGDEAALARTTRSVARPARRSGQRTIEDKPRRRWRGPAWATLVVAVAVVAGLVVAHSSGQRLPGQTATGNLPSSGSAADVQQANTDIGNGDFIDAVKLLDKAVQEDPRNAEALASRGWLLVLTGRAAKDNSLMTRGYASIQAAEQADPSYPDAHFYGGLVLLCDQNNAPAAAAEFRQALADNPPAAMVPTIQGDLQSALAPSGPCTTTEAPAAGSTTTTPANTTTTAH